MEKIYIMLKNRPVLEINNYVCTILDYEHLPYSLRYEGINYDDVMNGWIKERIMNIDKANTKQILSGFSVRNPNPYKIAKKCYFTSLTDCYWMKLEKDPIQWKDVNLYHNSSNGKISAAALFGIALQPIENQMIYTPELTNKGMSAKAWIRERSGLHLYKIGKKELAASEILGVLRIPHVKYSEVALDDLQKIADKQYIDKISNLDEKVVKSRIVSTEDISLIPWEDFQLFCSYHGIDEYDEVLRIDKEQYHLMQIADFILSNDDRCGTSFGFVMNNDSGKIGKLYPLMNHDQAFSSKNLIYSKTANERLTLKDSAFRSIPFVKVDLEQILKMDKPVVLTDKEWNRVVGNTKELKLEILKNKLNEKGHTKFIHNGNCIKTKIDSGEIKIDSDLNVSYEKDGKDLYSEIILNDNVNKLYNYIKKEIELEVKRPERNLYVEYAR